MNKDTALDLALEALEYIDLCDNDRDFLHPHECFQLDEAITAIKQARSAPVQEPVGEVNRYGLDSHGRKWHGIHWYDSNVDVAHGTKLYTVPPAQPAPVQEPDYKVTVVDDQHPNGVPLEQWGRPAPVQEPWKYRRWNDEAEKWELTDDCGWPSKPLYTAPPAAQRPWIGLTDEERDDLLDNYITAEGRARAIEAKLKEKNT